MNKKIIIPILIIIFVLIICLTIFLPKNKKYYLDDKYYNTEDRLVDISSKDLEELMKNDSSFALFTYLPYCTFSIPCDVIFETFLNNNNMSFYSIPFDDLEKVDSFNTIKYAPSIILVKKGKIVKYLDANSDDDLIKYQDVNEFSKWIEKYIHLK